MENKKVKIVTMVSVVTLVLILVAATYAYFIAQTGEGSQTDIRINANTVDTLTFETGNAIGLSIDQNNFAAGKGNVTGSTFAKAMLTANNKTNLAVKHYYMFLDISNNTFNYTQNKNTPEILLSIKDTSGKEVTSLKGLTYKTVTDGNGTTLKGYDITTKSGVITIFDNRKISTISSVTEEWNVTVTFVNYNKNQSANAGKSFSAKLMIQTNDTRDTLESYLWSLYTGEQGENNVYFHDGTITSDDVNNFICFGSYDENCPEDNLYRIIGIFDNQVKLIKYDYNTKDELYDEAAYNNTYTPSSIGIVSETYKGNLSELDVYAWSNESPNAWSNSNLNTINLNTNLLEYIDSDWTEKIAEMSWVVGGNASANILELTPANVYNNEVVSPTDVTFHNAKIGLMYVSDYMYAASPSAWSLIGYSDDETKSYKSAVDDNWMYMGMWEWTITPNSEEPNYVYYINYDGSVNMTDITKTQLNYGDMFSYGLCSLRSVFYLDSNVTYASGTGTMNDPIRIN